MRRRLRYLPLVLLAVLPLVPIGIGLGVSAPAAATGAAELPGRFSPLVAAGVAPLSPTPPFETPDAPVAKLLRPTSLRASPGGRVIAPLALRTHFGSPTFLAVVGLAPGWLGVLSPAAGNGRVGWIPVGTAAISRTPWEIDVSVSRATLTVLSSGQPVARYRTAVGRPTAPTPTGHFAVTDRLLTGDSAGPYGCCILALSAVAPHSIEGWGGGNRVAIHSTSETASIGHAVSHGCVRVTLDAGRWLLAHITLGTPVYVRT